MFRHLALGGILAGVFYGVISTPANACVQAVPNNGPSLASGSVIFRNNCSHPVIVSWTCDSGDFARRGGRPVAATGRIRAGGYDHGYCTGAREARVNWFNWQRTP
jgi:hypothetical protein